MNKLLSLTIEDKERLARSSVGFARAKRKSMHSRMLRAPEPIGAQLSRLGMPRGGSCMVDVMGLDPSLANGAPRRRHLGGAILYTELNAKPSLDLPISSAKQQTKQRGSFTDMSGYFLSPITPLASSESSTNRPDGEVKRASEHVAGLWIDQVHPTVVITLHAVVRMAKIRDLALCGTLGLLLSLLCLKRLRL